MNSELYELLTKLKSTTFTKNEYDMVRQAANKQGRKAVNLWKFKPQIRILFRMGKFQSYMMLFLGITVLPFTLWQKYQQDKQKLTRILLFTPFALGACLGPIIMYKRFSKKLIESISYNFDRKNLLLTRFRDGMEMEVNMGDINVVKSDRGKVKELVWNQVQPLSDGQQGKNNSVSNLGQQTGKCQIQGLGEWESVQLFNFIMQQANKQYL